MISLNNIGSAADALHYFTHDNYYTQEEGLAQSQWWGEAASRLGLSGQIDKDAFFCLLEGKVGEQELGRYERNDQGVMQRQHRELPPKFRLPKVA
jgi:conjugative relaxase-like TrwC/TraI family protein